MQKELSFYIIPLCHNLRNYLEKVSYDTVVSNFKDRRIRILIDCYDDIGVLHSCKVLNSAGNTAGKVNLRLYSSTCLAYLMRMVNPAIIYACS